MPQSLRTVEPPHPCEAKDSKPALANLKSAVELTPGRPPRFSERARRARKAIAPLHGKKAVATVTHDRGVNTPPPKGGGFGLWLEAGLIDLRVNSVKQL